jgi:hypothetical protein
MYCVVTPCYHTICCRMSDPKLAKFGTYVWTIFEQSRPHLDPTVVLGGRNLVFLKLQVAYWIGHCISDRTIDWTSA